MNQKLCGGTPAKPVMLFITANDPETLKKASYVQNKVFRAERVALAAKFFKRVQVQGDTISRRHPLYRKIGGKELPRVVLLTRDGKYAKRHEGRISSSKLFKDMCNIVKRDSRSNVGYFVKKMRSILGELDKLDADKYRWSQKYSEVMESKKSKSKVKRAQRESKMIDGRSAQIDKMKKKLMEMTTPKSKKKRS